MRFSRTFLPLAALLGSGILLGAGCASKDPEGSLASAGGTVGRGGGSAKGGTSGSANGTAKGGSGGSSATGGSSGATGGSSGATGGSGNSSATGGTGNTSATGGTGNSTASGGSGAYPTSACEGLSFDAGGQAGGGEESCSGVSNEAEPVPIDLYIMMDRSVSMGSLIPGTNTTRWEALQQAVEGFVDASADDDVRAGIGFFGVTGGNDDLIDCNQNNYSTPKVEIGRLDDVGGDIVAAMADMVPGGLTPEGPALAGALEHAAAWAEENPGRVTAVVLVSDGYPTQCTPNTLSGLADIAEQAHLEEPYIRTYVIGLAADFNLDAVALAGGTRKSFLVDEKTDVAESFASVLRNVANSKLACEYALPPSNDPTMKLDYEKVQVTYTTADGQTEEIPSVPSIDGCAQTANGGWYYDNLANPTSIKVCPCTCTRFDAGRVDVRVGCKPRVGVR